MIEDVTVKRAPGFRVVSVPGPTYDEFTDEAFGELYKRLEAWLVKNGLKPKEWISHFYESPDSSPEQGRSEACISFVGNCSSSEGIEVKDIPGELVASFTTTLDRVETPEDVYERIYNWISRNGFSASGSRLVREVYRVDPWEAEASETQVEFQVPIKRAEQ